MKIGQTRLSKRAKSVILGLLLIGSASVGILGLEPALFTHNPTRPIFVIIWNTHDNKSASNFIAVGVLKNSTHLAESIPLNVQKGIGFGIRNYTVGERYDFIASTLHGNYDFGYQIIEYYGADQNYFVVRLILPPNVTVDSDGYIHR